MNKVKSPAWQVQFGNGRVGSYATIYIGTRAVAQKIYTAIWLSGNQKKRLLNGFDVVEKQYKEAR